MEMTEILCPNCKANTSSWGKFVGYEKVDFIEEWATTEAPHMKKRIYCLKCHHCWTLEG
jgi:hypothetical protein